jgi:hypothetical protein
MSIATEQQRKTRNVNAFIKATVLPIQRLSHQDCKPTGVPKLLIFHDYKARQLTLHLGSGKCANCAAWEGIFLERTHDVGATHYQQLLEKRKNISKAVARSAFHLGPLLVFILISVLIIPSSYTLQQSDNKEYLKQHVVVTVVKIQQLFASMYLG